MPGKNPTTPKASKADIRAVTIKVSKGNLESVTVRGLQDGKVFSAKFPHVTLAQVAPLVANASVQDVRDE